MHVQERVYRDGDESGRSKGAVQASRFNRPINGIKRCKCCERDLPVSSFPMARKTGPTGNESVYPKSRCHVCIREQWRAQASKKSAATVKPKPIHWPRCPIESECDTAFMGWREAGRVGMNLGAML